MRALGEFLIAIVFAAVVFASAWWWVSFRWNECRGVGHSILYCAVVERAW